MNADGYKDFLCDLTAELIQLAKDPTIFEDSNDFNRGYRSALYSVIHLIETQADSWDIDRTEIGLGGFCADDWRRLGKSYSGT